MSPEAKKTTLVFLGLAAGLGPLVLGFSGVAKGIVAIDAAHKVLAASNFAKTFAVGGPIALGIAAIVVSLALLAKGISDVKKTTDAVNKAAAFTASYQELTIAIKGREKGYGRRRSTRRDSKYRSNEKRT